MSIITKMLKGKCVYWAPGPADRFGQPTFIAPVEIKCRWEDLQQEFLDIQGRTLVSNSTVYSDRDLVARGVLWNGLLANLVSTTDPFANPGASEIVKFNKLPNFKQTEFVRTAVL